MIPYLLMGRDSQKKFFKLYKEYFPQVQRYIYYRVGFHREIADDLTSEIFLKAYEKFDSFDQRQPFRPWIFTIARNHLTDHYRSRKQTVSLEEIENTITMEQDLAAEVDLKRDAALILAALPALSPEDQELVRLRYLSEYSYKEIAEILGKSVNVVQVALHRAVHRLRNQLMSGS